MLGIAHDQLELSETLYLIEVKNINTYCCTTGMCCSGVELMTRAA